MSVGVSRVLLPTRAERKDQDVKAAMAGAAGTAGTRRGVIMPKRSPQQRAGFSAEAFVDKAVSDAGHVWNDTRRDFGIDGHIEFVDADTQVSGFAVAAQVKGTAAGFAGENQAGFRFRVRG